MAVTGTIECDSALESVVCLTPWKHPDLVAGPITGIIVDITLQGLLSKDILQSGPQLDQHRGLWPSPLLLGRQSMTRV